MHITLAQLNYKLGDFQGNFLKIAEAITQNKDSDLIIFSELCLCGYYPKDLIEQPLFFEMQNHFLEKIKALTKQFSVAVILGIITQNPQSGKPFHNSLCILSNGQSLFTYHKKLLPVYNIFDEARHFAPGNQKGLYAFQNQLFGLLICEDGWAGGDEYLYECDPVNDLANQQCNLIICINASPSNIGKQAERIKHFSRVAKKCKAPLVFVNQVGANDDIVFDGTSFVLDEKGKMLGCLPSFTEATGSFTLNRDNIILDKHFQPYEPINDIALFYEQAILGLRDYVAKCGFKDVIVGTSGGIDSALTLALAVKALSHQHVIALAMPSRYSSEHSLQDAKTLCENLNVKLYTASIEPEFQVALSEFEQVFGEKPSSLTTQNMQARIRGRILMAFSNQTGALVLSTGNKSELSVGYTTLYGDMTGGLNLIGDFYKTDVYQVSQYFNEKNPNTPIPLNILNKTPSAELDFNQKDSDTLPEYDILDSILKRYIEGDLLSNEEWQTCEAKLKNIPAKIISSIHEMVNKAEFKRRQAPPIIRVQRRSFGHGRQLPITASFPAILKI